MESTEPSDIPLPNPMHLDQEDPFGGGEGAEAFEASDDPEKKFVKGVRAIIPDDLSKFPGFPDLQGLSNFQFNFVDHV